MALRKPLVIVAGQIQQLQAGDVLQGPFAETEIVPVTNGEATTINKAQAVYVSAADTVKLAKANAIGTALVIGFVFDATIAAAATGNIQTAGLLGGFTLLTSGAKYFLDPTTAGAITATAPTTVGQVVVEVGVAVNATTLQIAPKVSVLL